MSRETFIDSAIARGMTGEQINASLGRLNYEPLSKAQVQQLNEGTYGLNFGQRFKKDIVDIAKGGATMIGRGVYDILNPQEGLEDLKKVGNYLNTSPSLAGDLTNLILSPYNVDLPKLVTQSPIESGKDILTGALNHPGYALLDTLPVTGNLASAGVRKGIKALPEGKLKSSFRGLTEEGQKTNQILSESRAATADTIEQLRNKSFRLQQASPEDLAIAIKNIESPTKGAWVGNEAQLNLTKELRDMVKETNDLMVKAGFNPEKMKTSAVNQYIVRNLEGDVPLATVERALKDKKFALDNGLEYQKLKELETEGTNLYNKDLIQPFKHSTDADMAREGLVDEALKKQRGANDKLYGTQSFEDLARGFIKEGYTSTINKLRTTEGAMAAIRNMADEVGRKVDYTLPELTFLKEKPKSVTQARLDVVFDADMVKDAIETGTLTKNEIRKYLKDGKRKPYTIAQWQKKPEASLKDYDKMAAYHDIEKYYSRAYHYIAEDIKKLDDALPEINLKADEVLVSPRLLNEKFGTSIANGEDILGDINSLSRGLNKAERAKYADDLYIFNKEDIEALKKAYNPRKGILGDLGNIAKMGVLATPRYIAGNAITNMMIAPITGASIRDFLETAKNIDKLPQALQRSSSYSGYLGERLPIRSSLKDVYGQLAKDIQEGSLSRKIEATNMAVNYPIFKTAQGIEAFQRSVEFVNQARKYAKENNKTFEAIMREAKKNGGNNKTFRDINYRVQKYYGDYLGRNYYLPSPVQTGLEIAAPFYRPLTQGVRQFYNATKDMPLETQAFYRQPSLAINNYAQQLAEETGTDRDPVYGGYPIVDKSGKLPGQVIYSPYHAYSPVGELLQDPMATLSGNTFAVSAFNPILGRNKFGEKGKLPNAMESFDGNLVLLDNNGNPTGIQLESNVEARLRTLTAQYAQQFLSPVTQANSYILPTLAAFTGQTYKAPADTSILGQIGEAKIPYLMEGNIGGRVKQTPNELLLPLLGATIKNTYKEKTGEVVGKDYRRYGSEMRKRLNRMKWER